MNVRAVIKQSWVMRTHMDELEFSVPMEVSLDYIFKNKKKKLNCKMFNDIDKKMLVID
jgi:hypothetical protein